MESQAAQAATITGPTTWNLSFFSEGEQVGSGRFSIETEPFEGIFAEAGSEPFPFFVGPGDPELPLGATNPIEIDASDNFHQLTSFSATIDGTSYFPRSEFLFIVPPERVF